MDSGDVAEAQSETTFLPAIVVSNADSNKDTIATADSKSQSDLTKDEKSKDDAAEKSDVKNGNSYNTSSEASNVSKEKRQAKPKTRVIQSRFRAGLSGSKNNSSSGKSGLSSSENSNSKNSLNCTMSGSTSLTNSTGKNKPARPQSSMKSGIGKSVSNITKMAGSSAYGASNLTSKTRPIKSTTNLNESHMAGNGYSKTSGRSSKLHSTVLAERTMLGSSNNLFSTTLVGGYDAHGKRKVARKLDTTIITLPEIPDISVIRLDSTSSDRSGDVTTLSTASDKDLSQEKSSEYMKEITLDDLLKGYSRYLQSAYIDAVSDDAFNKQLEDLKVQLAFLDQLTSEKQSEVDEMKLKLALLKHEQNVYDAHAKQTERLQDLVGCLPESEAALEVLTGELEKNLHQVKIDNLYVPENQKAYRDDLDQALRDQITCLTEMNNLMQPHAHQLDSTISLMDELQVNSQRIQQYKREVTQASRLAIQEASMQIAAKQVNG